MAIFVIFVVLLSENKYDDDDDDDDRWMCDCDDILFSAGTTSPIYKNKLNLISVNRGLSLEAGVVRA